MLTVIGQAVVSGLAVGAVYALAASGLGIIFGLFGVINFAHTQYLMLGAIAALWLTMSGVPYIVAIAGGMAVAAIIGGLTERLIIRPLIDNESAQIDTLFVTLGLAIVIENVTLLLWGSQPQYFNSPFSGVVQMGNIVLTGNRLFAIAVTAATFVLLHLLSTRTRLGKAVVATAQSPMAARIIGISVEHVRFLAFVVGAGLAGLGGVLWGTIYSVSYITGGNFLIMSFVLVVMSGPGNIMGILTCSLLLGMTESLTAAFVDPKWDRLAVMLVFIIVIVRFPQGLFGEGRLARSNI
ncbi:MAG: branched-chain amino acid ABC transporter permease [Alphaproteobacteria bacterium]|nr:branched-chain amino acid ABC transporter permease [Alphaproteobacteria bacterium]